MVAVLVVLTIAALLAADYFLLRPRRHEEDLEGIPLPGLEPLSAAASHLPAGVLLQPTFTWSRIQPDGHLLMGVHPLLFGLVGAPYEIDLLPAGEQLAKGAPLARIKKGHRTLTVRTPVAGRIVESNGAIRGETDWSPDGGWLYRLAPDAALAEMPGWMMADQAREWTRQQYQKLREYLMTLSVGPDMVRTLADGGEVPAGILATLDAPAWNAFEHTFLGQ